MSAPASEPLTAGKPSGRFRAWLLALLVVGLLFRLPLIRDPVDVRNDGAEYLAIARSLRTTGRYATDLKYHFWSDVPVRHEAWADRPPLYPAFAALWQLALPILDPILAARLGNVLTAGLAFVLAALFMRRLYGETTALLAAGYTFFLPHSLYWSAQPMTEPLWLALSFGALLAWTGGIWNHKGHEGHEGHEGDARVRGCAGEGVKARRSELFQSAKSVQTVVASPWPVLLAGIFAGLAYLTRPTGGILFAALLLDRLWAAIDRAQRQAALREALGLTGGFLLCALPYHGVLWARCGSPFASTLGYTLSVATYYEVTYYGFERRFPGVLEFLSSRGGEIPGLILRQAGAHAQALLLPLLGLLPLAAGLRRADFTGPRRPLWLLVVLTLAACTLLWSAWGSSRYFQLCLPILAAALIEAGVQAFRRSGVRAFERSGHTHSPPPASRVPGPHTHTPAHPHSPILPFFAAATAVALVVSLGLFYVRELRADHGWVELRGVREAAREVAGLGLVASDRPNSLNLLNSQAAVMLPRTTDAGQLGRFITKYQPEALVLFLSEPQRSSAEAMAAAWRAGSLPGGWELRADRDAYVIALPTHRR